MLRGREFIVSVICLSILTSTVCCYADEEIEDLVDIFESKSKVVAIIEGKKSITYELRPKEKVLWRGAEGYLGALLTNLRFLVISTSSSAWRDVPLRLDESQKGIVSLSPYIALLVAGDRAIAFEAAANRLIEAQLPFKDELIAVETEKYIAVVITSSRAFGLAAKSSAFSEIILRTRETIESVKLTSSKATVRTSNRLLTFEATGSTWYEHRLH